MRALRTKQVYAISFFSISYLALRLLPRLLYLFDYRKRDEPKGTSLNSIQLLGKFSGFHPPSRTRSFVLFRTREFRDINFFGMVLVLHRGKGTGEAP